ncbi:uncharacterized protein LOC100502165 [Zea mays]|uniref:Uncharacterized protein n=1 Tax=Zea mays TaxID=4577 RepID=C4J8W0_MAIZE|nr:uncharacterized protein LOC100502165 [Zea mays]ACR37610.1 unknown [Zea mays]|eukprot:NP_001183572.1 uncharacterized protein LOC100502165 [Zea mays]
MVTVLCGLWARRSRYRRRHLQRRRTWETAGGVAVAWSLGRGRLAGWRLPGRGRPAAGLGLSWTRAAGRRTPGELWMCGTAAGSPCVGIPRFPPVRWDDWWCELEQASS